METNNKEITAETAEAAIDFRKAAIADIETLNEGDTFILVTHKKLEAGNHHVNIINETGPNQVMELAVRMIRGTMTEWLAPQQTAQLPVVTQEVSDIERQRTEEEKAEANGFDSEFHGSAVQDGNEKGVL